jgi:sigma-B regulation protein RsbU (phosphoserine phosphatase)
MPKTLIIDDDPEFIAICQSLADGHHSFVFADNDEDALDVMANDGALDLALVTLDGQKISGMNLFRKLTGTKLRVPRIAITARPDIAVVRQAIKEGAADFLTKPISAEDLRATLDKVYADCEARRNAWRTEAQLSAIRREIDIAGDLQKRIIPTEFPSRLGLDIAARIDSARQMSGDFYDFFDLDEKRIGLVVADVSGKGIPAAFYMAVARTLLRATAMMGVAPAQCLSQVNIMLCRHNIPSMFVSAFYGILDTETWRLEYANAGHLPPYHIHAGGTVDALEGGEGVVLGVTEELPYEQASIVMAPGDALFFYTDGLVEAFDANRNQFSDERLIAYLTDNRDRAAHAIAHDVFAFVNTFAGEAEQSDDITSVVIKRF